MGKAKPVVKKYEEITKADLREYIEECHRRRGYVQLRAFAGGAGVTATGRKIPLKKGLTLTCVGEETGEMPKWIITEVPQKVLDEIRGTSKGKYRKLLELKGFTADEIEELKRGNLAHLPMVEKGVVEFKTVPKVRVGVKKIVLD